MRAPALARMGWWLGPAADAPPPAVDRRMITIAPGAGRDRPLEAWVFTPHGRPPDGALLLVPGLHPDGPADPRMLRFASVLAHAGTCVLAPFLPDMQSLALAPTLMPDVRRAFEALDARAAALRRPVKAGVMSISFGALPALRLAGHPDFADRVGGVLTFGGFARWEVALRFALVGGEGVPHDPLNRPAVFMNLLDGLPPPADRDRLVSAWRGFVAETWGRAEMKAADAWPPVAARWAETAHPADRAFARQSFGLDPGGPAIAEAAVARILAGEGRGWLDPRPALGGITAPLYVVHGLDDDVIPPSEAEALAAAAEGRAKVMLTGAYGHTGRAGSLLREARSMVGILRALRAIARQRR